MPTLSSPAHRPSRRWGSGLTAVALLALSVVGLVAGMARAQPAAPAPIPTFGDSPCVERPAVPASAPAPSPLPLPLP
ncbi:MAG TPA: hypothetical protein PKC59_08550, partial [Burkholderiaceae bacterium]|nr:hypothetical protein [Burkholderiaceae bacterium]